MLFMPPTPKATVIEIFYPGGLAYDYEWPARRALRFKHFAVWNDTCVRLFTNALTSHVHLVDGTRILTRRT